MTHPTHQERIVGSAIKLPNGKVYKGLRHNDCILSAHISGESGPLDTDQGFVTNTDRYVSREEAGEIAYKAGQTKFRIKSLQSEDLWTKHFSSPQEPTKQGWEERYDKFYLENIGHMKSCHGEQYCKCGKKELKSFIRSVEATARAEGYEEGARIQAVLDVDVVKEARKEERSKTIEDLRNAMDKFNSLPNNVTEFGFYLEIKDVKSFFESLKG